MRKNTKHILKARLDIPDVVERRFGEALRQIGVLENPRGQRFSRRIPRVAAALLIMITGAVLAAYMSDAAFFQTLFGDEGRADRTYDDAKKDIPDYARVPIDAENAEKLLGKSMQRDLVIGAKLKSYTGVDTAVIISNYLYDRETGCFFAHVALEREGGFPDFSIGANGYAVFGAEDWQPVFAGNVYGDAARREGESIGFIIIGVNAERRPTEFFLEFVESLDNGKVAKEDQFPSAERTQFRAKVLFLGPANPLPSRSFHAKGRVAAVITPIGLRLREKDFGEDTPYYVALEYADGSVHVIVDNKNPGETSAEWEANYAYTLRWDGNTSYCFQNLVDVGKVTKLIVNDMEYALE